MPDIFQDYESLKSSPQQPTSAPDIFADYQALQSNQNQTPNLGQSEKDKASPLNVANASAAGFLQGTARYPINAIKALGEGIHTALKPIGDLIEPALIKNGYIDSDQPKQPLGYTYEDKINQFFESEKAPSPTAGNIGEIAGSVAGGLPLFTKAAGVLGTAAQAGTAGYLGSDPNASLGEKLGNAGLSALTGGAIATLGKAISTGKTITDALPIIKTSPQELAKVATDRTLKDLGDDFSKATPETFFKHADEVTRNTAKTKDMLYNYRNTLAAKENLKVNLSDIKDDVMFYAKGGNFTKSKDSVFILNKVENGRPLTYAETQKLSDLIGKNQNSAFKQNNSVLSTELGNINRNIQAKLSGAGGSAKLQEAATKADEFYQNTYKPLADLSTKKILKERFSDDYYLSNALKTLLKKPGQVKATENFNEMLQAAHINAIKNSATDVADDTINLTKYAQELSRTLKDNPTPLAPIADKVDALHDAIRVTEQVAKARKVPSFMEGAGVTFGLTQNPILGAVVLAPRIKTVYSIGKAMKDPTMNALLANKARLGAKADPSLVKAMNERISKMFWKSMSTVPSRLTEDNNNN